MNENNAKCIRVDHKTIKNGVEKDVSTSFIDIQTFKESFVDERWKNERRTNKKYTIFGYFHTKTTVKFDENCKSVRDFTFPKSTFEAERIHNEQMNKLINKI